MLLKNKQTLLIFFYSFFVLHALAQKTRSFLIPDSLKKQSFELLEQNFKKSLGDDNKRFIYANAYYKKAKETKDIIKIANGMYLISYTTQNIDKSKLYADSIIALTKDLEDFMFPARGYLLKSNLLIKKRKINEALNYVLLAEKLALKNKNLNQLYEIKKNIGQIKINIGEYKEALSYILECYDFYKGKNEYTKEFTIATMQLANVYNFLKKPKLSLYYNEESFSSLTNTSNFYTTFLLLKGMSYFQLKKYNKSTECFKELLKYPNEGPTKSNVAISYYYLGEIILLTKKNNSEAKFFFLKTDSILTKNKEFITDLKDLRNNYIRLIEISRKENNQRDELRFLNNLISIDQYLNNENTKIIKNIDHNFDTPHLVAQKEDIIRKIRNENYLYLSAGILILLILGITIFYLRKSKKANLKLEEQFRMIMEKREVEIPFISEATENKKIEDVLFDKETDSKTSEISKETELKILKNLDDFVKNKGFLKPNIVQTELAKQLETNSAYLSKVVNKHKGKNFSRYINELRVNYAVEKLKTDRFFKKYSIEKIAFEIGFGSAESFSKAFYDNTGMQPSYFIKKLEGNHKK